MKYFGTEPDPQLLFDKILRAEIKGVSDVSPARFRQMTRGGLFFILNVTEGFDTNRPRIGLVR